MTNEEIKNKILELESELEENEVNENIISNEMFSIPNKNEVDKGIN